MSKTLELNCDMGESFGAWNMGNDLEILPYIDAANIACGFHGGDPAVMRKTVAAALKHHVALGAHPGLPDLQGFGRRAMQVSPQEVYDMVVYQIGALAAVAASQGARLHHIKAHGALGNTAAKNAALAEAIAQATRDVDKNLIFYAQASTELVAAGENAGLRTIQEVFADRTYQPDGSLTPRSQPDAMITDLDTSIAQVLNMVMNGKVRTQDGREISITADTLCMHGDQPGAVAFARGIRAALEEAGVTIQAIA